MNSILMSFLCGAAFIGGAVATTIFVGLSLQLRDKKGRSELAAYWQESISQHAKQLALLERMVAWMEATSVIKRPSETKEKESREAQV